MFREALTDIVQRLNQAKQEQILVDFALIGGMAVSAWGVPRATQDIDFVLTLGSKDPEKVGIAMGAQYEPGALDDPLRGVFRVSVTAKGAPVPIQFILFPAQWTSVAFSRVQTLTIFGCPVPVVSWSALILMKLYAGGPQDMLDAQELLEVHQPDADALGAMHALAKTVGLSDELRALVARRQFSE